MFFFFFFNDPATTEIYPLSLHDALPIWSRRGRRANIRGGRTMARLEILNPRSEEHTSELQSQSNLVCRLLLEKKKKTKQNRINAHSTIQHINSILCSHTRDRPCNSYATM